MRDGDISVGAFFRARLVMRYLIEPLMGGIYGTDIDKLSLMSTFLILKKKKRHSEV